MVVLGKAQDSSSVVDICNAKRKKGWLLSIIKNTCGTSVFKEYMFFMRCFSLQKKDWQNKVIKFPVAIVYITPSTEKSKIITFSAYLNVIACFT